jgi:aryl-alcohol dehydrogenase-like predicted oxidoreductase
MAAPSPPGRRRPTTGQRATTRPATVGGGLGANGDLLLAAVRQLLANWMPYPPRVEVSSLGSQGPEITVLGLGAWALGGPWRYGWGPQDDDESVATIRHAVESGVNWVDTAAIYGIGHSEEIVGEAIRPFRVGEEVLVFTKCGEQWDESRGGSVNDLRPQTIRAECDASLERLGIERIDLYQFHWPDRIGTPVEESWATMAELVDEGKVRWAGVCNFDVELLERCEPIRHVDSLQPPLSLLNRAARDDVIPWARDHGTGVIVYSPLASGRLTGNFGPERIERLAPDDWRRNEPAFQEPQLGRTLQFVERLRPIAERLGCTVASLAIAWALAIPGVTGAIVGARRPSQVDDWLPAGDLELPDDVIRELEELLPA